jgi:hypothetical protein
MKTLMKKCRCKKRWAMALRDRCIASGDAFVIDKGGKGPGDLMSLGLAQKYVDWIKERVQSRTTPLDRSKGAVSYAKKGAVSYAKKGAVLRRQNGTESKKAKESKQLAASAAAGPPPPIAKRATEADFKAIGALARAEVEKLRKEFFGSNAAR